MRMLKMCLALLVVVSFPVAAFALTAAGQVVDVDEKPLFGTKVYAILAYYDSEMKINGSIKAAVKTDLMGNFSFPSLPKPSADYKYWYYYFVAFEPDRHIGWTYAREEALYLSDMISSDEEKGLTITVGSIGTIEGVVVDKEGEPLEGATVQLGAMEEITETCDVGG